MSTLSHDGARAQIAALFEGREADVSRAALLDHLKGCDACRSVYDRDAQTMRRVLGNPEQMTAEELWLFGPPLPPAKVVPLFRVAPVVALALAASLAAFVAWSGAAGPKDDGFAARGAGTGNTPELVKAQPSLRALCMQGTQVRADAAQCAAGDTLAFAVTPHGRTHVKLSVVGGALIGEGDVADAADTALPWTVPFAPGIKLKAELATCPTCATTSMVVFGP